MPKDATKNIDRYKIRGGQLNEFDFQKNQEEFAEASKPEGNLIPGTPPEQREGAPSTGKPTKKAAKPVASTKRASTSAPKATAKKSTKKATAKKSAKTTKVAKASKSAKASKTTKSRPRGATAKKLAARKAAKK